MNNLGLGQMMAAEQAEKNPLRPPAAGPLLSSCCENDQVACFLPSLTLSLWSELISIRLLGYSVTQFYSLAFLFILC